MIELTAYRGDSMSFTIPLTNGAAAFTPGGSYSLIFTAKRSSKDPDTAAVFQKSTATGTITTSTTNAIVTVLYTDTTTEDEPVLYWDIQAQHNSTAAVITAAKGTLTLVRDITRQTTASVPIYTVDPAAGNAATPAGTTGSVQINNAGALAADSGLVFTGTGDTGVLKVGGGSVIISEPVTTENLAIGGGNPTLPLGARTTGTSNTVIGSKSLIALTTGGGNVAIGPRCFTKLTTGDANIAIGAATLPEITTGSRNISIGQNSLLGVTIAEGNIAIGTGAGYAIVTGWNNICIAASPPASSSENSICIGTNGDGSNTTVIGKSVTTQTRLVGNTLILGHASTTTSRTSLVQSASVTAKTITLPNATGIVPVFDTLPAASGKVLTSSGVLGAATWADPTAGGVTSITAGTGLSGGTITTTGTIALANTTVTAQSYTNADITVDAQGRITAAANGSGGTAVTGTAPIVVTSGVVSLATTLPDAYAFTSTTRPTSAATTATLAAASASSIITKGDADSRYGSAIGARVYKNNVDQTIVTGSSNFQLVTYGSEVYDYGSCWDTTTSKYTASVAGIYMVTGLFALTGGAWIGGYVHIFKNGVRVHDIVSNVSVNANHNTSTALYLAVGDYLEIKSTHATGADRSFSGYFAGAFGNAVLTISLVSPNF